jgi:hypothetical protein
MDALLVPSRVIKWTQINGTHDGGLAKKVDEMCCNNVHYFKQSGGGMVDAH